MKLPGWRQDPAPVVRPCDMTIASGDANKAETDGKRVVSFPGPARMDCERTEWKLGQLFDRLDGCVNRLALCANQFDAIVLTQFLADG